MSHLPHHSPPLISIYLTLSCTAISLICFFFFSFHLNTLLSITLILSTGTSIPHPPFPPSFFRQDHRKILKNLETPSHPFFKVKISNLFGGFYTFAWGYFYLSFNNNTHVIYEHWKWYLCVYMYEFCIGGIIWWVGLWFVLMVAI